MLRMFQKHTPAELAARQIFRETILMRLRCAGLSIPSSLILGLLALPLLAAASRVQAEGSQQKLPLVLDVEQQPLVSATQRLVDALSFVGAPLKPQDKKAIEEACADPDAKRSIRAIQAVLDPYCLVGVTINPESRVSVVEGPAGKELVQQGWRTFLVKVQNQAGITATLRPESPNLAPVY